MPYLQQGATATSAADQISCRKTNISSAPSEAICAGWVLHLWLQTSSSSYAPLPWAQDHPNRGHRSCYYFRLLVRVLRVVPNSNANDSLFWNYARRTHHLLNLALPIFHLLRTPLSFLSIPIAITTPTLFFFLNYASSSVLINHGARARFFANAVLPHHHSFYSTSPSKRRCALLTFGKSRFTRRAPLLTERESTLHPEPDRPDQKPERTLVYPNLST